jgi:hypothetical protein
MRNVLAGAALLAVLPFAAQVRAGAAIQRAERRTEAGDGEAAGNGRVYGIGFRTRLGKDTYPRTVPAYVPDPTGRAVNDGRK